MTEIEIGNVIVLALFAAGFAMIAGGWFLVPPQMKRVVVALALMFVGWCFLQFIAESIIVIAK